MAERIVERGKIKKIMQDRSYGFITRSDGTEAFFHDGDMVEGTINTVRIGQMVEYILVSKPRGYTAKMIVPLEEFEQEDLSNERCD
ncbi:MAG: cold shock domain-containing protein [Youngiibacter sp.]|nr:cold shock domain-containing protein [Youngiibacter sp.]